MTYFPREWPVRWLVIAITLPSIVSGGFGVYFWFQASSMGEECRIDGCRSGFCYTPPRVGGAGLWSYCTHDCKAPSDCPDGYECVGIDQWDDPFCRMVPFQDFGADCFAHETCVSGHCQLLKYRDPEDGLFTDTYCIQPCDKNNTCPPGGKCITSNHPPMCIPAERLKHDAERYFAMQKRTGMENIAHTIARQQREEHEKYLREHPEARKKLRESRRKERRLARILMRGMDASLPDAGLPNTDSSSTSATADSPASAPLP